MTSSLFEVLRVGLRNSAILGVAAAIILLVVIFSLLELSYRQKATQDYTEIVTGTLPNSPAARAFEFQPASAQRAPLAQSGARQDQVVVLGGESVAAGAFFFSNVDIRPVPPSHALDEFGPMRGVILASACPLAFSILRIFVVLPLAPCTVVGTHGFTLATPFRFPGSFLISFLVPCTA